ncbi:MAG: T9SS type A sorting domain-containing protein [Ferruginibacter sp.]|nr:T9SS type A sorting domain-containing protein [Ferruginibacter sp.]
MKLFYLKCIAIFITITFAFAILSSCNYKNNAAYEQNENDEEEHDEYDEPGQAAAFENKRNMDPTTGKVDRERMWQAVLQTEGIKNINNYSNSSTNALTPLTWLERGSNSDATGPSNGNTRPGNGVTSGRMRTLWVDLADATGKTVWVGGISGGLWKTTDITATTPTWTLINDYLSNLAVSGITQDPTNTNIMYFCTGESYFTGGGVGGVGVFKSTDHGVTWAQLANTSTQRSCTKILCDATGNVYYSTLGVGADVALMRSMNGGASWVNINPFAAAGVTQTSRIPDFEISSTGRMHVIGGFSSASATLGGYRYCDNPTAATPTWQSATTMFTWPFGTDARTELSTVGNTIYASLGMAAVGTAGGKIEKIAKSTDGGDTWITNDLTAQNISDLNGGGQGGYSQGLTIDPSNTNTVIVGSLRLLKSTDGGVTFTKISEWVGTTGQYVHADIHNMAWYDGGNKLLVCSDGGLFYSTNKGTNFTDKNTGLRLKQFYGVSIHPTQTNYFLAGAQDNGTHQFTNPGLSSSIEVLGGDGGITAIDQDEPQFQTGAYVFANFRRSSNGGATWASNGSASNAGQFINPYDYDNTTNKVYAGYSAGQYLRWENPQSGFTLTPVSITEFGTASVASATVSPYTANRVFFGLTNGKVFKIDNADQATPTVTEITPAGTAAGFVNSVNIGVSDQDITVTLANAFATATTSIWSTTNGGTSWASIDGNLPEMPVYWALYHPDGDTKQYIATETGVWSTDLINGAATIWTPENTFPTVKTSMLKYRASDRTIAAATYGRGLWTAIIPSACTPVAITTQAANASICDGTNASFSVTATGTVAGYQWQLSTTGAGGPWTNITNNTTYSNATTTTLNITAATIAMNTNQYRCLITGSCAPLTTNSNPATLTVNAIPAAPTVTPTVTYCQGATATALTATGTGLLWYAGATGGAPISTPTPSTTAVGSTIYYVSQTVSTCESPRSAITVTVNATPLAPTVTTPVNYCQGATATALTATGTNLKWYTVPTAGIALGAAPTPSTAAVGSTIYYVSSTIGICEGPRAAITVTITGVPAAPTVTATYTYCQGFAAPTLTATGTNLLWYAAATGGTGSITAPTPSTASIGTISYFVSQTTGCESPRAEIMVTTVAGTAAPTVTSPVVYCQGATSAALSASGTALLWYTTASGGPAGTATAPTPSTTSVGNTIYYVTQTLGICESPRTPITVTVNATPPAPTVVTPVNYCQNMAATALTATGTNLKWYANATGGPVLAGAPTPTTTTLGSTTYYVSSTIGICEGPRAAITVIVAAVSPMPTVVSPVTYCQNTTSTALTATGTNLLWYAGPTGGTGSATAPIPSTTTAGSITYYVTQNSTCGESPRAAITVTVNATPAAPTATTTINYCQGATATALTATGSNLIWYANATGGPALPGAPTPSTATAGTTNYYVSQTVLTCESPRTMIAVTVTALPSLPTVSTPLTYCIGATATALTATGTNLKWYTVPTAGVALAGAPTPSTAIIGSTTYYVSQTTGTCESGRAPIIVNVTAVTAAPTVITPVVYCQGATATALSATGTNLLWYAGPSGGTGSATAPTVSTTTVGSTTYYVSQTGNCESPRTAIVVTVNPTPIAPVATTAISYCQGSTASALTATGTGLLWYTSLTGTGSAIAPTPSTTATGTTTYYVSQTTGICEGPKTAITVTVTSAPAITTQPQDITSCATTATFTVTATGTGLTYQWYVSTDGGLTYNPILSATSNSVTLTGLTPAQSNNKYRVIVSSGTCTAATSNAVSARVGTNPVVILTAAPTTNFNPYTNGGLYTTISPVGNYTYQWRRNSILLSNSGSSITKANGLLDEFGSYVVTVTDVATGCTGLSNSVSVSDIDGARGQLFVSPNPTTGKINVSYYNSTATAQALIVNVYNEKGAKIITKDITLVGRYGTANVDLSKFANGTYIIILRDATGKKVATNKVIKY